MENLEQTIRNNFTQKEENFIRGIALNKNISLEEALKEAKDFIDYKRQNPEELKIPQGNFENMSPEEFKKALSNSKPDLLN